MGKGWDEDVALSAMREADGNTTAALLALEDDDRLGIGVRKSNAALGLGKHILKRNEHFSTHFSPLAFRG